MILKYPTYQYPIQWSICDYFSSCKVVDTIHTTNIFFTKILLLDRGQHEAMSQTKLLHQPAISQQTQNIFSSNNCQTSCCRCSDLFITCLHFCLAPWYLCTCKSFFWYMLACLSTSLKSHHGHVYCPCWSSWLQSSDQRRDGGGDPHTRQESTASSPQKEN